MTNEQKRNKKSRSNSARPKNSSKTARTTRKAVKKVGNEIARAVSISVKHKGSNGNRRNNKRRPKTISKETHDFSAARSLRRSIPAVGHTVETKALLSAMLLPYEGALVRVRPGGESCISKSTAISRNHIFYDLDVSSLITDGSVCGQLLGGARVFENLSDSVSVVSVLDARIVGVVPRRKTAMIGNPSQYICSAFMNPNQTSQNQFYFNRIVSGFGLQGTNERYFGLNEDDVYWFDFCDFVSSNGADLYGSLHPPVDGPDGRYIWIDAQNDETDNINTQTTFQLAATKDSTWLVPPSIDGDLFQSKCFLVLETLPTSTNTSDVIRYTSCFLPDDMATPIGTTTTIVTSATVRHSAYYKIGICGKVVKNPAIVGNEVLANLEINIVSFQMNIDSRINVGADHIVNPHIVSTNTVGAYNLFDTIATNFGSCLIKNVGPSIYKGGQIFGISNVTDKFWYDFTQDRKAITSSSSDPTLTYSGSLSKGIYGWLRNENFGQRPGAEVQKVGSDTVSTLRSWTATKLTDKERSKIRAQNVYLIVPPTTATPGAIMPTKVNLMFTVQYEYTTMNQIPQQSSNAITDYKAALHVLQATNTFTENPLHLGKFAEIIRSAGRSILGFYKDNRSAIQGVFSAMSAFGGPVGSVFGKAGGVIDTLID